MNPAESNPAAIGYVDGFVIPVPTANLERYREVATLAAQVWREYGALDYVEAVGEDIDSSFGIPFPKLAGTSAEETVIFSWIAYRDRAHRDEVNTKVMADERIKAVCPGADSGFVPPFDPQRMTYGGFTVFVKG